MRKQTQPLYRMIASAVQARLNCKTSGNSEWYDRWSDLLRTIERNCLPSGSGIDSGTTIDLDRSSGEKIVLVTSFHHMHESGMYDGWTEHTIVVTGSLVSEFDLDIKGRNRNDIKEYLSDVFYDVLREPATHYEDGSVVLARYDRSEDTNEDQGTRAE